MNGTAGSLKGQRVNCHDISAKFSIDSYQKKIDIDTSLISKGQEVLYYITRIRPYDLRYSFESLA